MSREDEDLYEAYTGIYDNSPYLKEMVSDSINDVSELKKRVDSDGGDFDETAKEKSSNEDSENYKMLRNIIENMTEKIEKNKKGEIPHQAGNFLKDIMSGENTDNLKCNFHSFGGTKIAYELIVNGEISFMLYALMVLNSTGEISQVTRKGFTKFSKDRLDCNKIVSPDFCAVVQSTNQGQSDFRTRVITVETTTIEIKGYKIEVLIPKIVADIVATDSGEKWSRKTHKNIVAPYILEWRSAKPVKKIYVKFRAGLL